MIILKRKINGWEKLSNGLIKTVQEKLFRCLHHMNKNYQIKNYLKKNNHNNRNKKSKKKKKVNKSQKNNKNSLLLIKKALKKQKKKNLFNKNQMKSQLLLIELFELDIKFSI